MKIVLATGGSGGHLIPALMVAKELEKTHEVSLAGSFPVELEIIQKSGYDVYTNQAQGLCFNLNPIKVFRSLWRMYVAVRQARKQLRMIKPDAVIGFGGYGAFPVVLSAFFLKIPTMIHEQNVVPGRANAILSKIVKKVAISFGDTREFLKLAPAYVVETGCPCHLNSGDEEKERIYQRFHLQPNKSTILVLGGSQGSHQINKVFFETIQELNKKVDVQVIHVTGKKDYSSLKSSYQEASIPGVVFDFLEDIVSAYKICDLTVSRAGAVTIAEICHFNLPAIIIPYPYAGGHQMANAQVLRDRQGIKIVEEHQLTSCLLGELISGLLQGKEALQQKGALPGSGRNAAKRVAQEVELLAL